MSWHVSDVRSEFLNDSLLITNGSTFIQAENSDSDQTVRGCADSFELSLYPESFVSDTVYLVDEEKEDPNATKSAPPSTHQRNLAPFKRHFACGPKMDQD